MTAKRVRDPRRNVGRASMLGTAASAVLYVMVTAAVMGLVPHHALVNNTAPFVTAFQTIFSHGVWAGKLVAALAVASGIGALNGWTLVTAEVSRAVAQDGLFRRRSAGLTARIGLVRDRAGGVAAIGADVLELHNQHRAQGVHRAGRPHGGNRRDPVPVLACAQLAYLVSRRRRVQGWLLARDLSIAGASVLFSMWVTFAAGYQAMYQSMIIVLAGVVLYAFVSARRGSASAPAEQPANEPLPSHNPTVRPARPIAPRWPVREHFTH